MAETATIPAATRAPPPAAAAPRLGQPRAARDALLVPRGRRGRRGLRGAFRMRPPARRLPRRQAGERAALWLGPDEWLLLAPEDETAALFAALEAALGERPHALVDISHRQVGFAIAGAGAATLLTTGCPLDLDAAAFPVGMCTRTVLAKSDVALWRRAPDVFRLEVNRSFADYVAGYLRVAERALG